jgi:hypothetical protein
MNNITEGIMDFKSLERTIFIELCKAACQVIAEYLQRWDQIIMARRDTNEYRSVGLRPTSTKTVMGTVHYERWYYRKRGGGYTFLLDEAMGTAGGHGMVSENLAEQVLLECADKSFRKAADSIGSLTGQTISRMGAWNVVQGFGGAVQKQEGRLEELDSEGVTGQLGNVPCPVLFSEMDDVWLNMQRGERRKAGAPAGKRRKRVGMRPMHIATTYTGWIQMDDGRHMTANKFAYAGFGDSAAFTSMFEVLLRQRFDMDGVERHIANGDGEAWVRAFAENNDAILQLDPFHRGQAIMRAVKGKADRKAISDAFKEKNVEKALDIVGSLITNGSEEATLKKLVDLLTYLDNNRDSLLPWQDRGVRMPEPPKGITYRNLGTQEHSNCDLITQRMKHRKGAWSTKGANNMARLLCLRGTIGLGAMLGALPEPPRAMAAAGPLSAAKAPQHDGKGCDASWLRAGMPFEGAFVTAGREAIRGLLKQRPLSDLAYK